MPKRGVIALVITTVALVMLLNFKTPDQPINAGIGSRSAFGRPQGVGAAPGAIAPTAPPEGGDLDQGQLRSRPQPSAPAAPPASTPSSGGAASGVVDGPVVQTRYGDVQVEVTFAAGKMTDVKGVELPFDRQLSQRISNLVAPILRDEALQAQSAQIDLISGATYTSEAYAESLQGAIDQAHG